MSTKPLSTYVFVCAFILVFPIASYACDTAEHNLIEMEKKSFSTLIGSGAQAILYNFRTRQCMPLSKIDNTDGDISAFLPSDETSLGMYQFYRDQGKNNIDALKNVLEFMITEQQS